MGLQAKADFTGLMTATGEVAAPQGALRKADNVTLRDSGALTTRQTWAQSVALARAYRAVFWYQGSRYYLDASNVLYSQSEATIAAPAYPQTQSSAAVRTDIFGWEQSRNNLYLATGKGILKLTSTGDTTLRNTGISPSDAALSFTALTSAAPNILANNTQVAYRLVGKCTDPNGLIIRSRPSGAFIVSNTTGSAKSPNLALVLDTTYYTQSIDEVEVYRTRMFPTSAVPDDEMQLVASLKASTFVSGNLTWVDTVSDANRTTTLYTSPSRGGIENAADRPPGAACIEGYRGHLFFGNTQGPQRFIVSFNYALTDLVGVATGVGFRTTTGNTTSGSTTITSVANTTGLERGMIVAFGGGAERVLVGISGSTLTVASPGAPATGTGVSLTFYDAISPDNGATWIKLARAPDASLRAVNGGAKMQTYTLTPALPGYDVTWVVESKQRGTTVLRFLATHGGEMNPPLAVYGGTATNSAADNLVHGLAWSEPDEPEHVPPKNFARVGDGSKAILGLTAMTDCLLIWKEDGLFRLTGAVATGFRIDPVDPTAVCILPGSIRRVRNSVFALTTLGIVRVDDSAAVQVVSAPIAPELAAQITDNVRAYFASNALYRPPSIAPCVCATADEANGEYWLMAGAPWETTLAGQVLVFNVERNGFTTYTFTGSPSTMTGFGQNDLGQPAYLLSTGLYEPTATAGAVTMRVAPYAFTDPALVGKLWTHVVCGLSTLGSASSIQATFTSSESQLAGSVSENFEANLVGGVVTFPGGALLRHPVPLVMRRAWALRLEVGIVMTAGSCTLELIAAESREDAPNKRQTVASGAT